MHGHQPSQELDLPTVVMWNRHVASLISTWSTHCVIGKLYPAQTYLPFINPQRAVTGEPGALYYFDRRDIYHSILLFYSQYHDIQKGLNDFT